MRIAAFILVMALVLVACSGEDTRPAPADGTLAETPTGNAVNGNVVEIAMTAKNWEFEPNVIRVKKGDIVRISVTSEDVAHGVGIEGYTQFVKLEAGETAVLEFTADKAGTFRFYCNVPCGQGHREMTGQLIVE
jgi:cytochrome c oxidase subunit II